MKRHNKHWTNDDDLYLAQNFSTGNLGDIARELNRTKRAIRSRATVLFLERETKAEYALYKGDELMGIGTVDELADQQGIKETTIRYYLTPSYQKRMRAYKGHETWRAVVRL